MPVSVFSAGALRPLKAESVMIGGTLRKLKTVKVMRGGILVTIAMYQTTSPLSAVSSPNLAYGYSSGRGPIYVSSNPVTATVTGGVSPFTYSWVIVSGTSVIITNPSSATTQFEKVTGTSVTAGARCTVTDSLGAVTTCDCAVQLEKDTGL
jgi:hypothetical protein